MIVPRGAQNHHQRAVRKLRDGRLARRVEPARQIALGRRLRRRQRAVVRQKDLPPGPSVIIRERELAAVRLAASGYVRERTYPSATAAQGEGRTRLAREDVEFRHLGIDVAGPDFRPDAPDLLSGLGGSTTLWIIVIFAYFCPMIIFTTLMLVYS